MKTFVRALAVAGAVFCVFAFAGATGASAGGVSRTWVGGVDGSWTTADNWSPSGVPAAGDDVTIGAGCAVTVSVATAELNSFSLSGTGAKLTMAEPVRAAVADCVTVLRAGTVSITGGAVVTHVANKQTYAEYSANTSAGWMIDGRVNIECTTFTLDADSKIDANGLGYDCAKSARYPATVGPGGLYPKYCDGYNATGGHGGYGCGWIYDMNGGEAQVDVIGGQPYDTPEAPVMPGSSGTANGSTSNLSGGGVVRVAVSGTATIDGIVCADARTMNSNTSLGSGGSVWVTAQVVRGSGKLTANGGFSGSAYGYNYCGAGGRVALVYDPAEQDESDAALGVPTLRLQAATKWTHASAKSRPQADVGSVYMTDDRFLGETFDGTRGVMDGQIYCGTWSRWHPRSLTVTGSWVRFPEGTATNLALSGDVLVSGVHGRLEIGGDEAFPYCFSVNTTVEATERASRVRRMSAVRPRLACANLTLADGGQFMIYPGLTNGVDQADGAEIVLTGDFTVGTNSFALLPCHPTNGAAVKVTAENVKVDPGAWLSSAGQGFMEYKLPGTTVSTGGIAPGYPDYVRANGFAPSHGGYGTRYVNSLTAMSYDSLENPLLPGSPGNRSYNNRGGGSGGGVVLIVARSKVTVDGTVDARGQSLDSANTAPGSGGTVNITCRTIAGSGTIDASGGRHNVANKYYPNWVGAGGRVAVHYDRGAQAASGDIVAITWKCGTQVCAETVNHCCRANEGGLGTVWFPDTRLLGHAFGSGTLTSGEFHFGTWTGWTPADVVADGPDVNVRLVSDGNDFVINGNLTIRNGAALGFGGGTNYCTHPTTYLPFSPAGKGAVVKVNGSVIMEAPGQSGWRNELHVYAGHGCTVQAEDVGGVLEIARQFMIGTNSWVYPSSEPYSGESVKVTVGGKVNIDPNAGFDATGLGYSGGSHPAREWHNAGYGPGAVAGRGRGSAYGGIGGCSVGSATTKFPLPGYGTSGEGVPLWQIPSKPGSGSSVGDTGFGGPGGGCIWIETKSSFKIAGSLIADGQGGAMAGWSSSGSGGAVYVRCRHWVPDETAVVRAKGGATGGAGGGGCIAIWRAMDHDLTPTNERTYVSAPAGSYGNTVQKATDGTIYWGDLPMPGLMLLVR
ncbi:MAG: hypothetical protein J6T01_01085 [Kiritimatiellae bacterium]|nr:hypothetical protein [Kiritimatiellia bacterium]